MKVFFHTLTILTLLWFCGCPSPLIEELPPKDRAYFPSHLIQDNNTLYVFSYNQDLRYVGGSILELDLTKVGSPNQNQSIVSKFNLIPSFAEAPLWILQKSQMLFLDRSFLQLHQFHISENKIEKISALANQDPKYLSLISETNSEIKGLIGYLNDRVSIEKLEDVEGSCLENYGELQVFALNPQSKSFKISKTYLLQNIPQPATTEKPLYRRISHIGGMRIIGKDAEQFVLLGVDALPSSANLFSANKEARLLWFSANGIENQIDETSVGQLLLTPMIRAEKIAGLDVAADSNNNIYSVYLAMEEPSLLVKVKLQKINSGLQATYEGQAPLCDKPSDIRVAPDQKTLLVSCAKNHEVLLFSASDLTPIGRDSKTGTPFGRGPVHILFDERPLGKQRAYVSYSLDGSIGVFEIDNTAGPERLKPVGRIFNQAPFNHPGGE